ncbi:MAG: hypothetical protein K8R54_15315 [Bacteroidales bacterium]|nr:hypothetical protein [Bacteroidales bacterium]
MSLFNKKKHSSKESKKSNIKSKAIFVGGILFGIIPFMFIVYLLLGPLVEVIQKDFSSQKMMVISEELNIRSDKMKNSYVIGSYPYGTEVNVYEVFDNDWAEVSIEEKKGFMSFEYLVLPETFYIIDGMYGNENAKEMISSTKYRKAISTYLTNNNFTSKIPITEREKLYGKDDRKEVWQIFAESRKSRFNTFCYGDYNGDKKNDAAFIITNIKTGNRKLIVLNIETEITEKYGELITFKDLEEDYKFIKHVSDRTKMIINDSLQRTGVDAILLGTNRDKSLKDIPELIIYNGKTFDFYLQEKKEE